MNINPFAIAYYINSLGGNINIGPIPKAQYKGGGCRTKRKVKHKGFGKSKFLR